MHLTQERWNLFRAYGIRRGLSHEDAEDFAQVIALRCHAEGYEPRLSWAYADFIRKTFGRLNRQRRRTRLLCGLEMAANIAAPEIIDLKETLSRVLDTVVDARAYRPRTVRRRLAVCLGISQDELRTILKDLSK